MPVDITPLKDPNLLINIIREVQKRGTVGNEKGILVLANKINMRRVKNVKPEGGNILVTDKTGGGKDKVTKDVIDVMVNPNELIHRTDLSDKVLNYWCSNKPDDYTFDGKIFYLEDPQENCLKGQAFRTLTSGHNEASTVQNQKILDLVISGKPIFIVTSYSTTINREGDRRWDGVRVDTTDETTRNVTNDVWDKFGGKKIETTPDKTLITALQHGLECYDVVFPYSSLTKSYTRKNLKERTKVKNFIDTLKSITVLHQHQRDKDEHDRLISTLFDYEVARIIYETLNQGEGITLNVKEKEMVDSLRKGPKTTSELANNTSMSRDWFYKHQNNLVERGIVNVIYIKDPNRNNQNVAYWNIGEIDGLSKYPPVSEFINIISSFEIRQRDEIISIISIINNMRDLELIIKRTEKQVKEFKKKLLCYTEPNNLNNCKETVDNNLEIINNNEEKDLYI